MPFVMDDFAKKSNKTLERVAKNCAPQRDVGSDVNCLPTRNSSPTGGATFRNQKEAVCYSITREQFKEV